VIQDVSQPRVTASSESSRIATELASRRTGMSFQRTRMSAARTLMSVIRTSLSLMAFGFTIAQFFSRLADAGGAPAARSFGTALLLLGVLMLALGIFENVRFIVSLRATRIEMTADGLIHGQSAFPPSLVLVTALLLLLVGLIAITSMVFHVGPF
jgi:putative membrane protein